MATVDDLLNDLADLETPQAPRKPLGPPQPLSFMERLASKVPTSISEPIGNSARGVVTYAAAPAMGVAQIAAHLTPGAPAEAYDQAISQKMKEAESAPWYSKLAGAVAAPTNIALGSGMGPATTFGARSVQGGVLGGVQGLMQPVDVGPSGKFWEPKAIQSAVGAGAGAVFGPLVGAVADRLMARFGGNGGGGEVSKAIAAAAKESGQNVEDLPADQVQRVTQQATAALEKGKRLDAAAALRKADFDAEGIRGTLGQVTRDPMQFARERNARGLEGVGGPLTQLMSEGNTKVMRGIGGYASEAAEPAAASQNMAKALRDYYEAQQAGVRSAYTAARQSAGKDLDIPLQGLAQDYASAYETFGKNIPQPVRAKFAELGLDPLNPSNQKQVFTFEDADKLRKIINANQSNEPAVNAALGAVRKALDKAQTEADASGGPFAPAVAKAREVFDLQRKVPALADAMQGVDDTFVRKQIISNPSTPDVQKLANLLRENAPEQFQQARAQIGQHLMDKAFGANAAGSKEIAQEQYNRALKQLGTGKLSAFFEPDEVEQLKRLGRIAAYQVSEPAGAASNYSNTASAVANLLRAGTKLPVAGGALSAIAKKVDERAAMNAVVPLEANLSPAQRIALARVLALGSGAAGAGAAGVVGQ